MSINPISSNNNQKNLNSELLSSSTNPALNSNNVYLAGEEDLSSIGVQAGSNKTSVQSQQQSAYSQLSGNTLSQPLPSPMDLASQQGSSTSSSPAPSTPKI